TRHKPRSFNILPMEGSFREISGNFSASTPKKEGTILEIISLCTICRGQFKSTSGLQAHVRMKHDDNPRYKCDCGKGFLSKAKFKAHRLKHINEKGFKCDACGNEYSTKTNLTYHIRCKHSTDIEGCPECLKPIHRGNLKRHKEAVHGNVKHKCPSCHGRFSYKGNLTRHMKTCKRL
ncbi:unnamed protein product, partial [Owenia fusiformis]